jgi:hypothetical protein
VSGRKSPPKERPPNDPELRVQNAVELRAQARPPGTEFLDAETGRQKPPLKCDNAHRDENPGIEWPTTSAVRPGDREIIAQLTAGFVVYSDRLIVRLKSDTADEASDCADDRSLTISWQKPPSKRSRQILLPYNASRSDVRPEQFERRARLVSAIARGCQFGVAPVADIYENLFLEFAADGARTVRKHNLTRHPMRRPYLPVCTRVIREPRPAAPETCHSFVRRVVTNSIIELRSIIEQRMRACESD